MAAEPMHQAAITTGKMAVGIATAAMPLPRGRKGRWAETTYIIPIAPLRERQVRHRSAPGSLAMPDISTAMVTGSGARTDDVVPYQERQGAVLLRRQRLDWLDHLVPESELLRPLPIRSFTVEGLSKSGLSESHLAL